MVQPHRRRPVPWGAAWAALLLVCLEAYGLRLGWFWQAIRDSTAFQQLVSVNLPPEAFVRIAALRADARSDGSGLRDTVLVVGHSAVAYGLDADVLSHTLHRRAVLAWEAGADLPLLQAITAFVLEEMRPGVVVLAASPTQVVVGNDAGVVARRGMYAFTPVRDFPTFAKALAERMCALYRWRTPLWQFSALRLERTLAEWAGTARRAPVFDFTPHNAPDFWRWRNRWHETGAVRHYWWSMQRIVRGQPGLESLAEDFRNHFPDPNGEQWHALEAWIETVRAAGARPAIVLFPFNGIVTRSDFASAVAERRSSPLVAPEWIAQYRTCVQAIARQQGVPCLDQTDALGPEAFYDYVHLMPQPRRTFSEQVGGWVKRTVLGEAG